MSNTRITEASTFGSTPAPVTPLRVPGKLRTISQLEPSKFCDFIGEVSYHKVDHKYKNIVLVMTDYTDHPKLPPQEGDGRLTGILVTLWDEHFDTAYQLNICVGQFLHLKNLCCKLNKNDRIELTMNGYRGKGFKQLDPIQILGQQDPQVASLRR
ncbi:hypothetical protein EDD21DRAFT_12615 [Dissophora ornata]|nr:hypothetical protein EDD21DRAFT_12615 [Dissophora ornata]